MGNNSNFILKFRLLILLFPFISFGQTFKGKIEDTNGNPISNASIQIKSFDDSNTLLFTTSNSNGEFELSKKINQTQILLKISFIGFETLKKQIKINDGLNDLGTITLIENIEELKEVIVKAESSGISQKGDTITYKVEKFLNGTEENLKDVIEKIPGLNVNDKGKITANGKTIDKLLIDGEDLYKNQHQIATENLPSNLINSIELIQNYIGYENLNKEEKSGKKALNIKIKEEYKNKVTGFIEAGKGFDRQYKVKKSIFNFNKKFQFSVITNLNNIAENPISIDDYLDLTEEKEESNESKVVFSNLNDIPNFLTSKDRISTKKNIFNSINLIYNINKKTKFDFYSIINNSNQTLNLFKEQKYYDLDTDLTIIEDKKNIEKNTFGTLNAKLVHKKNENTIHIIKSNFLFDISKNTNNIINLTNSISKEINQDNQLEYQTFNLSYNLSKKIKNSYFNFKTLYINSNNNNDLEIKSNDVFLTTNYLNSDNSLVQYSKKSASEFKNLGSYQFTKNKFTFQFLQTINFNNSKLNSVLNNSDNINNLKLNNFINSSSLSIKYQINSIFDISFKPDYTFNNIDFNNNSKFVSYFGYKASLKARFNSTNILQISNSLSNNNTNVDNLLVYDIVKDYRTVTNNYNVASTSILPSLQYNLNYFSFDIKNKFSFIFNASHRRNIKSIENNIISTENITFLRNGLISGEKFNSMLVFIEKQPQKLPFAFSISTSYTNLSKTVLNNNDEVEFKNHLFSGMFEIKSRYKEFPVYFNVGIKASNDTYLYNNFKSELNSYQIYCKLNGKIFKNIYWNLNTDYFNFKNQSIQTNYLNISPILRFSKEKTNFEYSLIGNNILNIDSVNVLENYSNSNYSELIRKPVLSGYVLFQLKYKF